MDDEQIISLYFQRDQQAIEESRNKYGPYCAAVARRILPCPEDAEECVNDALLNAWGSIPPQRPRVLSAFLGTITRNLALDRLRQETAKKRGGGQVPLVLSELEDAVPDPAAVEDAVDARLLSDSINRFLHTLPEKERKAFVRRYWYVCPVKEVAAQGGMSESAAASLLRRLRKELKQHLEKEGITI